MTEANDTIPRSTWSALFLALLQTYVVRDGGSVDEAAAWLWRFGARGCLRLIRAGVPWREASAYHERFDVWDILAMWDLDFLDAPVTAAASVEYSERCIGEAIAILANEGIDGRTESGYPQREDWGVKEVELMVEKGIAPATASAYPDRFGPEEVAAALWRGLSPEQAAGYPVHLAAEEVLELAAAGVPADECYPTHLSGAEIRECWTHGVSGVIAARYPPWCSGDAIVSLVENSVSPAAVAAWECLGSQRLFGIDCLIRREMTLDEALTWSSFLSAWDIDQLCEAGISPAEVEAFAELTIDADEIVRQFREELDVGSPGAPARPSESYELAADAAESAWPRNHTGTWVLARDAAVLESHGLSPADLLREVPDHPAEIVAALVAEGASMDEVRRWPTEGSGSIMAAGRRTGLTPERLLSYVAVLGEKRSGLGVYGLTRIGVEPEQLSLWPERFTADDIAKMARVGVDWRVAPRWPERLTGSDIAILTVAGVAMDIAREYPARFGGGDIARLHAAGIVAEAVRHLPQHVLASQVAPAPSPVIIDAESDRLLRSYLSPSEVRWEVRTGRWESGVLTVWVYGVAILGGPWIGE